MANLPTTKKDLMAVLPDTSKTLHLPGLDAVIGGGAGVFASIGRLAVEIDEAV